ESLRWTYLTKASPQSYMVVPRSSHTSSACAAPVARNSAAVLDSTIHFICERCFGTPLGVGLIYRQGGEARERFKRRRAAVAGARLPRSMEGARRGDCWARD